MDLSIRDYRPADLTAIKQITIAAFDGVSIAQNMQSILGNVGGHDWTWHKARAIDADAQHEDRAIFVAEVDGAVVAYVTTRLDREAGIGFIPNMAVNADHQGKGIGRKLLLHALENFRRSHVTVAHIETLEQNAIGKHLYPEVGFQEVARQIHYTMRLE